MWGARAMKAFIVSSAYIGCFRAYIDIYKRAFGGHGRGARSTSLPDFLYATRRKALASSILRFTAPK